MIKTKISKWGNSQGIRLPKTLLEKVGINDFNDSSVKLSVDKNNDTIVIRKETGKSRLMQKFGYLMKEPNDTEFDWRK